MIIIKSIGGLGNQLFQYALYKRFLSLGREAKIDFSQLYRDGLSNELNIFDNKIAQPTEKEIARLGDCGQSLISKVRRKAGIRKKNHIIEKASYTYDPDILKLDSLTNIVNQSFACGQFSYGFHIWKKALHYQILSYNNLSAPLKGAVKFILKKNVNW